MKRAHGLGGLVLLLGGIAATSLSAQTRRAPERLPPPEDPFTPKFEALAETKLLMEGLAQPNYRALEKHLQGKGPPDRETWTFARGQALLIAETGNLLLLRPPRNAGRETWMRRAMDMRQSAGNLARRLGNRDLARSRAALLDLANKCNSCHQTFRIPTRVGANDEP
ncbi:MAG TPA: cytochrome c [Gemmataceae bacterium]|nr:cytochrome c [Gemmataceae bacterium]